MEAETKPEKTEPEEAENLRKIFTGGLNRETTDEQMKEYFEKFGEILDCIILRDSKNESKYILIFIFNSDNFLFNNQIMGIIRIIIRGGGCRGC